MKVKKEKRKRKKGRRKRLACYEFHGKNPNKTEVLGTTRKKVGEPQTNRTCENCI